MANVYNIADFKDLDKSVGPARITGSFSSSSIPISSTGYSVHIGNLLNSIVSQLSGLLRDSGVNVIDTSPISKSNTIGLAKVDIQGQNGSYIDKEAGKIYVDVSKIIKNTLQGMLPANVQLPSEGSTLDPDLKKTTALRIYEAVAKEIADTIAHESQHKKRTIMNIRGSAAIDYNPESEAKAVGNQFGKSFKPNSQF